jgi:hypothetical protein
MPRTLDALYENLAAELPDEALSRELERARRDFMSSVRTRKEMARHRVACLECELKRRADQRAERNPGRA